MSTARSACRRAAVGAAALLVVGLTPNVAAGHDSAASGDPGVVLTWNELAVRTILVEGATPPPVAQLYLGMVSTAVDDAVVTAERGWGVSSDVAAATAAHDVLAHYFPASAAALQADHDGWLSGVPDDRAKREGLEVGHDAAAALIESRADDGRNATVPLPPPAAAALGGWVPTGSGEFAAPWLGFTEPLVIDSPTQFETDGPDALDSAAYAADFAEVEAMGSAEGSGRTAEQTALALFFSDNPGWQYQAGMRDRAVRHDMDIVESARMFAAANSAGADALITCWRVKYEVANWRPITAIHEADQDGNPATTADPAWTSLRPAPPYPDNPSGHGCVSSAVAGALEGLFGEGSVDMDIPSRALDAEPDVDAVRHYDSADAWLADVTNARIWLGFHFRDAMDDAREIGRNVAETVLGCTSGSSR
jgi:hypothetical protein